MSEPLTGFHENGKAQGDEKGGIDKSAHHFRSGPSKSILTPFFC